MSTRFSRPEESRGVQVVLGIEAVGIVWEEVRNEHEDGGWNPEAKDLENYVAPSFYSSGRVGCVDVKPCSRCGLGEGRCWSAPRRAVQTACICIEHKFLKIAGYLFEHKTEACEILIT